MLSGLDGVKTNDRSFRLPPRTSGASIVAHGRSGRHPDEGVDGINTSALIFVGPGGGGTFTKLLREFPQQRPFLSGRGVGPDQVPSRRFSGVAVGYGI